MPLEHKNQIRNRAHVAVVEKTNGLYFRLIEIINYF